ncbi:MAG: chalcone isomerase family protein [Burkholderiales bacterium]|nr:chalcone isomerase family protein [Burkholderiales bacterium]
MKVLKSAALAVGLLFMSCLPVKAHASVDVAGVRFDDRSVVGGQSLVLNGAGLRVKMIIKVYAVALYLAGKDSNVRSVLTQPGAKCVRIVMLRNVSGADLAENLIKGMIKNLTPTEFSALQSRLDELQTTLHAGGDAQRGEVIELTYLPGAGTRILADGKRLGRDIPGDDFYQGLLKIWLGEQPSDSDLKAELLGTSRR